MNHLEEQAELYALGMLEGHEHERVDAHVRTCRDCAERLGRAEAAVAALTDAALAVEAAPPDMRARVPIAPRSATARAAAPVRRPSLTAWAGAAAAVFAITSGALVAQNVALQATVATDGSVFGAMVHSHFSHVQFTSPDGAPFDAKVVYERHGGWYEILATGIDPDTHVAIVRGTSVSEASQRFVSRGGALTVTLPALGAVDELRLLDAQGRLVARSRPALTPDPH